MPHVYRLPSGRWKAVVRKPDGHRTSKTDILRSVVRQWALDLEAEYRRGSRRDPRAGQASVADWYARWRPSRVWSTAHAERMDGVWRGYVAPYWGGWRLDSIRQVDVRAWVAELTRQQKSPAQVRKCLHLLGGMLQDAVPDMIPANPARLPKGALPPMPATKLDFYTTDEIASLAAVASHPHDLMIELAAHTGLRWAELAGLQVGRVGPRGARLIVTHVLERDGTIRPYPKSRRSSRVVPVPESLQHRVAEQVLHSGPDAPVFQSLHGHYWRYQNFRHRVWLPAVDAAGLRDLGIHGLRHTAASWLAMAGVDLLTIRDLMGHESQATTERYSHLMPGRYDVITQAWGRMHVSSPHVDAATRYSTSDNDESHPDW